MAVSFGGSESDIQSSSILLCSVADSHNLCPVSGFLTVVPHKDFKHSILKFKVEQLLLCSQLCSPSPSAMKATGSTVIRDTRDKKEM